jgi:hypothetical protein
MQAEYEELVDQHYVRERIPSLLPPRLQAAWLRARQPDHTRNRGLASYPPSQAHCFGLINTDTMQLSQFLLKPKPCHSAHAKVYLDNPMTSLAPRLGPSLTHTLTLTL